MKQIGLLLDYNDNFAKTVVDGVAKFSEQVHWRFMTHRGVPSMSLAQLASSGLDGVIGYLSPEMIERLNARGVFAVNVKTDFEALPTCSVLIDNVEIGRKAADYLIHKGLRRFAYAQGEIEGICGALKFDGFCARLAELNFECVHLERSGLSVEEVFARDSHQPLGVLGAEDFVGRMLIDQCEDAQLRVPDEVSVLGVNNSPFICCMVKPQMSSMELGAERIGYQAALLLDQLMQGAPAPVQPMVIAPENIVERMSTNRSGISDQLLADALRFIAERASQPIHVSDVARAVGCCRRTLEKRFKERLERSPHEEIRRERIRHACNLLRETDTLVEYVAESCGYVTRDRFNVAFRREMGMTPSAYRKQYRFAKRS